MNRITIELTDAEMKALAVAVADPKEWAENAVKEMCRRSMEEIFSSEVARMVADPSITDIPADVESVVLAADIPSGAELAAMNNGIGAPVEEG